MGIIKQYRPDFMSGWKNEEIQFETKEELLNIDWVNNFTKPQFGIDTFYRFSISKGYVLMAEYEEGQAWYVVGYISDSEVINQFPKWERKSKA